MQNDPLIGQKLGAYLLQAKLGEGGMARVYKAYHISLRRDAAIKVILAQFAVQAGFKARFEQEAQLIAQLNHPNIVTVYDFGESGELTYLVMQYVGGGTLREQLRSGRPLEPRRAVQYALQMARALHHAHLRGIVHRDVKPQNMLVSSSDPNQLLLSDFGIAKLFASSPEATLTPLSYGNTVGERSLTNVGQIVGTAEYMAPEQANMQPVDARTDVYSLGVVLFQMLTGQVPFQSGSAMGLLFQQVHTVPLPARELNPGVPEMLSQITAKALQKAPAARFQSAEAMAQALEAALAVPTHPYSAAHDYATELRPQSSRLGPTPGSELAAAPYSNYGRQTIPGAGQGGASALQGVTGGAGSLAQPVPRRAGRRLPLSYIMAAIVLVLLVVFAVWHPFLAGGGPTTPATIVMTTAFSESFQDNARNWTVGTLNGLTANTPGNGSYSLTVSDANTYFPNPAAVGTLPANFTLTAQMAQESGSPTIYYGLAFHLTQNGNQVACYAFVIDRSGGYQVLKYNAGTANRLWNGQLPSAIHGGLQQLNTLAAIVRGNTFSFMVNGTPVPLSGGSSTASDASYTGGQLALLVTGPNASFSVKQVQLALP